VEQWKPTQEDKVEILDAACDRATKLLQFAGGGPIVGEQAGDDPLTTELILANGWGNQISIEFEVW